MIKIHIKDIAKLSNPLNNFHIASNLQIGQEEEDFEEAFNQIFNKKVKYNDFQEDLHELDNQIYYLKGTDNYIEKKVENQLYPKNAFSNFEEAKNILKSEKIIINEKESRKKVKNEEYNNIKVNIFSVENNNSNEKKKMETNNNIITEMDKQNIFRVYSLNDFNLFHPGGNVEYFRQLKEELGDEIIKQMKEENKDNKTLDNLKKFKISKEKTKKYKKKVKEKRKRKEKPDDVRKKIKSRFLKTTKNRINHMLKTAKSKEFFDFLPQSFICNISKQKNKVIINMTFKELMSHKFFEDNNKNKNDNSDKKFLNKKRNPDEKKYNKNIKVLKYLEKNNEICRKSYFNVIGNMTFKEMFNEYLKSEEFEKEIEKLKTEQNNDNYIKDYILKAYSFINYFSKSL